MPTSEKSFQHTFTLESLLETHTLPFVIIDENLTVVAVNNAREKYFGLPRTKQLGNPCCINKPNCRHQTFFKTFQAYAGFFTDNSPEETNPKKCWLNGNAITNADGKRFLGETLTYCKPLLSKPQMLGVSKEFLNLQLKLQNVARTDAPVLLIGETGTGKEVAAKVIHQQSNRVKSELIIVDCTLLTESLFESELFGHEKGAFTNAVTSKKGLFELADNGTLFLDEIGELPLSQQPKLLRALESGQFRRVGGTQILTSNVRVVCATHRNLGDMIKEGRFREDLFYRLSVLSVEILPLRERKQDIALLAEYFLRQEGHKHCLTQKAFTKLIQHTWPGNIRELKNCMQLAVALANDEQIDAQQIHILRRGSRSSDIKHLEVTLQNTITQQPIKSAASEKELIQQLIVKFQGNRKQIATEIGVSERTLYRKLNLYQLDS
ncbi:MAG: sigma-54-dependent Fis family transcriptional regulator [Methylococcaceae bacterium]|nr:sigma-54-dependent Fis family transcriptional regulator [Methylococcaceae bacterium]